MITFYKDQLYPLQDRVLKAVDDAGTGFYLTGGTALSRCYYNHRYSDDLDFFVNKHGDYKKFVQLVLDGLAGYDITDLRRFDDFTSFMVDNLLKVDLVNDVASHIGVFNKLEMYSRVDNPVNILSNKISALVSRDEPKDVVDIVTIAKHEAVDWKQIFLDVSSKAVGIFPPIVAERLETFPLELLYKIKWCEGMQLDEPTFKQDISGIVEDLLRP